MKKINKGVKTLLILSSYLLLFDASKKDAYYNPSYEIVDNNYIYATYAYGNVYIIDKEDMDKIDPKLTDVIIIDERYERNNMKILASYRITDPNIQKDILNVIDEYEKEYPSWWERSVDSMQLEWIMHNLSYAMRWQTKRAKDADFETREEKRFNDPILKYIFK